MPIGNPVLVQEIHLVRRGDRAVVEVAFPDGKVVEVISEPFYAPFSHYITEHGLREKSACMHGVISTWRTEAIDQGLHVNRLKAILQRAVTLLGNTLPTFPVDTKISHVAIRDLIDEANVWLTEPGALASEDDKERWWIESQKTLTRLGKEIP